MKRKHGTYVLSLFYLQKTDVLGKLCVYNYIVILCNFVSRWDSFYSVHNGDVCARGRHVMGCTRHWGRHVIGVDTSLGRHVIGVHTS